MTFSLLAPSFLPASAVLEMTYECNHRCLFCSCPWEAKSGFIKREQLSKEEWKTVIKTVTDLGVSSISFTGGEPLLNEDIKDILKFAASLECKMIETEDNILVTKNQPLKIYLISNGSLVTDEILNICKEYNIHLSMSLPGLKTYFSHTDSGSPDKILQLFHKARSLGVHTTVNITVTKLNLFELYETVSNSLISGAETVLLNRFLPGGRGLENFKKLMLNKDEVNEMLDVAEEVLRTAGRYGHVGTEIPKCIIKDIDKYKYLKVSTICSAGRDFFVIGPSGYIRACNHSPVELCYYKDFESLKSNKYWNRFVFKEYCPDMCRDCIDLYKCDCGCREAAHVFCGNLNDKDPLLFE